MTTSPKPLRHLLYHVTPIPGSWWEWNLAQLKTRLHIFNGVKLVAIAQGKTKDGVELIDWKEVRKSFPVDLTCGPLENDTELRETASLRFLLEKLRAAPNGIGQTGITFYGHTKGTSRGSSPGRMQEAIRLWTTVMYAQCLDRLPEVEKILEEKVCCGAFKRYGRFGHFPRTSHWHYSGTFFWFRNKDLFAHPDWRKVPRSRYGAEAYLSTLFDEAQAGCIFGDGVNDLYNVNYLRRVLAIRDGSPPRKRARPTAVGLTRNITERRLVAPLSDQVAADRDGLLHVLSVERAKRGNRG